MDCWYSWGKRMEKFRETMGKGRGLTREIDYVIHASLKSFQLSPVFIQASSTGFVSSNLQKNVNVGGVKSFPPINRANNI